MRIFLSLIKLLGGANHKILEAAKKVEILHEKVNQAVAISDDLPTVLLRLKTLESLHHEAASFNVQLTHLTETTSQLKNELEANSELLKTLKQVRIFDEYFASTTPIIIHMIIINMIIILFWRDLLKICQ